MSGDDVTSSSHSALQYRRAKLDPPARVVKSVDTGDLKSPGRKAVPVQVRPRAPSSSPAKSKEALKAAPMLDL